MAGRPVLYSMCNWGEDSPWNWAQTMANSWRISGDVYDSFDRPDDRCPCTTYDCALPGFHCSVMNIINKVAAFPSKAQPGGWNDLDMLEVGNGGMTDDEYILHFSMWFVPQNLPVLLLKPVVLTRLRAILKSPLIMGTDIRTMTPQSLSIYSNPAVLAVSQDPAGSSAYRIWKYPAEPDQYGQGEISLWVGSLDGGDYVVALVNAGNYPRMMNASLADIFYDKASTASSNGVATEVLETWDVYDLWANRMSNATAQAIISGNSTMSGSMMNSTSMYNATQMSYAKGLAMNTTALLGAKTTSVTPMGTLSAMVPRHGVGLYRIRSQGTPAMRKRDEL